MEYGKMYILVPILTLTLLLVLALPGYTNPRDGFSGVTRMTLTCTKSTGVNEALAVNAPQTVSFTIDVDGRAGADLQGNVNLVRLDGPRREWKAYFSPTGLSGKKTVTFSFPSSGPIPNTVGCYRFQAWFLQKDGTKKTSNIITVIVYTVRCTKIEATNDQDIYWSNAPNTDDRIWVADPDVYASSGKIKVIFDRRRIADTFRPAPQYYKLKFSFRRYPTCNTSQTLTTDVSVIHGRKPTVTAITGWSPHVWVTTRTSIGRRTFDLKFNYKVNSKQVVSSSQSIPGFIDYAIYDTPRCSRENFTNEHLSYACGWGNGSVNLTCDGSDSIPWVVQQNIVTAGYSYVYRENPWRLLTAPGDCDTHANLMKEVLAVLGVTATTSRMKPSGSLTRDNCGRPEHYLYRATERKRFKYNMGGEITYTNWQGVCTVVTSDQGVIHYDILGYRAYGTSAQMQDEDEDTTREDFRHDVIHGGISWVYDLENNQRGVCPVP